MACAEQQALEAELVRQRERRDIAHATLATRPTQKARNDLRVAGNRIERAQARLDDLHRVQLLPRDNRIFPGTYAPVMVSENGRRVIKPMRYQCRLPDKPARNDVLYPGTYNARRDSLEGYWRGAFGLRHGVVVVQAFYEHVPRHAIAAAASMPTKRSRTWCSNSAPIHPATCCWPASGQNGKDRKAPAFVCHDHRHTASDVAAAGHDRGVVPIRREHLDAWLNPEPDDLARQYASSMTARKSVTCTRKRAERRTRMKNRAWAGLLDQGLPPHIADVRIQPPQHPPAVRGERLRPCAGASHRTRQRPRQIGRQVRLDQQQAGQHRRRQLLGQHPVASTNGMPRAESAAATGSLVSLRASR